MSQLEDLAFVPERFSGKARLFPLPNLVLFPHVMQPLHVFEPRYRQLLEAALADDRLIAMALFAPGWEPHYEGRPPLRPIACLGKVATYQKQADDRYNILLVGVRRVRLVRELAPERLYREAEVEVLEDEYPLSGAAGRKALQRQLVQTFQLQLPQLASARDQLEPLLTGEISLGMLTDIVAYTLDLELPLKEQLLAETNVDHRAQMLLKLLEVTAGAQGRHESRFPPDFSVN